MSENTGSINPNVEVNSQVEAGKSVEVNAGETFTSFDALDQIIEANKGKSKREKAAPAKEGEAIEAKPLDKEPTPKAEAEVSGKDAPPVEKKALTEDTSMIEVTVDGKKEQVSLQDLKNHYSGKVAWDKKFTDLDKERKQFQSERDTVQNVIKDFYKNVGTDPKSALISICDLAGVDSVQFMRQLRSSLLPEVQKLLQMSEVERKAYDLEEENALLKRTKESVETRQKQEQEQASLMAEIEKIREAHKISMEDVKSLYAELSSMEGIEKEAITPTMIGEYANLKRISSDVTATLSEVRPDLVENADVIVQLTTFVADTPGVGKDDIKDIIEQAFGKRGSTKGLRKKVEAAARAEGVPLKQETVNTSQKTVGSDPLTFDDLE